MPTASGPNAYYRCGAATTTLCMMSGASGRTRLRCGGTARGSQRAVAGLEDVVGLDGVLAEALAVLLHLNEELMSKLSLARDELALEGKEESRQLNAAGEYERMRRLR